MGKDQQWQQREKGQKKERSKLEVHPSYHLLHDAQPALSRLRLCCLSPIFQSTCGGCQLETFNRYYPYTLYLPKTVVLNLDKSQHLKLCRSYIKIPVFLHLIKKINKRMIEPFWAFSNHSDGWGVSRGCLFRKGCALKFATAPATHNLPSCHWGSAAVAVYLHLLSVV